MNAGRVREKFRGDAIEDRVNKGIDFLESQANVISSFHVSYNRASDKFHLLRESSDTHVKLLISNTWQKFGSICNSAGACL